MNRRRTGVYFAVVGILGVIVGSGATFLLKSGPGQPADNTTPNPVPAAPGEPRKAANPAAIVRADPGGGAEAVSGGPVVGYHSPARRMAWVWIRLPDATVLDHGLLQAREQILIGVPRNPTGLDNDKWYQVHYGVVRADGRTKKSSMFPLWFDREIPIVGGGIRRLITPGRDLGTSAEGAVPDPPSGRPITLYQVATVDWETKEEVVEVVKNGELVKEKRPVVPNYRFESFLPANAWDKLPLPQLDKALSVDRAVLQVMLLDPAWADEGREVEEFWDKDMVWERLYGALPK